mmetsp:Transcript_15166/g.29965  ORF Transcript_15166/g.29965 Transcript_15166/m.29965 type:complete len:239 (+) Transcript_15166:84-800(+)
MAVPGMPLTPLKTWYPGPTNRFSVRRTASTQRMPAGAPPSSTTPSSTPPSPKPKRRRGSGLPGAGRRGRPRWWTIARRAKALVARRRKHLSHLSFARWCPWPCPRASSCRVKSQRTRSPPPTRRDSSSRRTRGRRSATSLVWTSLPPTIFLVWKPRMPKRTRSDQGPDHHAQAPTCPSRPPSPPPSCRLPPIPGFWRRPSPPSPTSCWTRAASSSTGSPPPARPTPPATRPTTPMLAA